MMERKRIFYGLEIKAPWPENLPDGRFLLESDRHMTLAFIGNVDYEEIAPILKNSPLPQRTVGVGGVFNEGLLLPPRHPRCVSWHIDYLTGTDQTIAYQKQLTDYLVQQSLLSEKESKRPFLPHVTICRKPFLVNQWKKAFSPLPLMATNLHLYESTGKLRYEPIWTYHMLPPLEEIDHTADIAFRIRGETAEEVFLHACLALAFEHPPFLPYIPRNESFTTVDDIIITLNELITKIDSEEGCPFKAVSFHGSLEKSTNGTLAWEMIVDV